MGGKKGLTNKKISFKSLILIKISSQLIEWDKNQLLFEIIGGAYKFSNNISIRF